jgi:hypothetical protein
MTHDLRSILNGWDYEPGKISVRKIIGRDGREKIQTRVDLGLLQLEPDGRPDGRRPYGCDSMLAFFGTRLKEYIARNGTDEGFVLLAEDCRDLRHEAHLYYQRYLSLFVLEEYEGVERDTERNLRVIELCRRYAETEYDRTALEPQRASVMMMHTRAPVYQATNARRFDQAMALLDDGIARLHEWEAQADGAEERSAESELQVLQALRDELLASMPEGAAARLKWELDAALESEDYERATELRDKLSALRRDEQSL